MVTRDYLVTVCASCLTASCWHMEFPCEKARSADIVERKASDLRALGREHPGNYSPEKLVKVCGGVVYL
jgi:hypothetical protein